ncbi:MAG: hypothetical protein FWD33_03230, partial [Alphaproteobacteria bacterium]|nr:hypothetical protein [Alphaproteobacteria bacterium]
MRKLILLMFFGLIAPLVSIAATGFDALIPSNSLRFKTDAGAYWYIQSCSVEDNMFWNGRICQSCAWNEELDFNYNNPSDLHFNALTNPCRCAGGRSFVRNNATGECICDEVNGFVFLPGPNVCIQGCQPGRFFDSGNLANPCTLCPVRTYQPEAAFLGASCNNCPSNTDNGQGLPWTVESATSTSDTPATGAAARAQCRKRVAFEVTATIGGSTRVIGRGYRTCNHNGSSTNTDGAYNQNCTYSVTSCGAGRSVWSSFVTATTPYVLRVTPRTLGSATRVDATLNTARYLEAVNAACEPCAAGRVQANDSHTVSPCPACLEGQFQSATGQTTCDQCRGGFGPSDTGFANSSINTATTSGAFSSSTGATSCSSCPSNANNAGSWFPWTITTAAPTSNNATAGANAATLCRKRVAHTFTLTNGTQIGTGFRICNATGTTNNDTVYTTNCTYTVESCMLGVNYERIPTVGFPYNHPTAGAHTANSTLQQTAVLAACRPCSDRGANWFSSSTQETCTECVENEFRYWNGSQCITCPSGELVNASRSGCVACPAVGTPEPSRPFFFWNTRTNSCLPCQSAANNRLLNNINGVRVGATSCSCLDGFALSEVTIPPTATVLTGTAAPANALGSVGNWFINTTNWAIFEKTGAAVWTSRGQTTCEMSALTCPSASFAVGDGFSEGMPITACMTCIATGTPTCMPGTGAGQCPACAVCPMVNTPTGNFTPIAMGTPTSTQALANVTIGWPSTITVSIGAATTAGIGATAVSECRKQVPFETSLGGNFAHNANMPTATSTPDSLCFGVMTCSAAGTTNNLQSYRNSCSNFTYLGRKPGARLTNTAGTIRCEVCPHGSYSTNWVLASTWAGGHLPISTDLNNPFSCTNCVIGTSQSNSDGMLRDSINTCFSCRGGFNSTGSTPPTSATTSGTFGGAEGRSDNTAGVCTSCPINTQATQITGVPTTGFPYTVSAVNATTGAETFFPQNPTAGSVGASASWQCRKRIPFEVRAAVPDGTFNTGASGNGMGNTTLRSIGRGYRTCSYNTGTDEFGYGSDCFIVVTACGSGRRAVAGRLGVISTASGTVNTNIIDATQAANAHQAAVNWACEPCPGGAGTSAQVQNSENHTSTLCTACTAAQFAAAGASACTVCPGSGWRWTGPTPIGSLQSPTVAGCYEPLSFCNSCPSGQSMGANCAGCNQVNCVAGQCLDNITCRGCAVNTFRTEASHSLTCPSATNFACNNCPAFTDNPALAVTTSTFTGFTTSNWGTAWRTPNTFQVSFANNTIANDIGLTTSTGASGCRKNVPWQTVPTNTAGSTGGCVGSQICSYSGTGTAWTNYNANCGNQVILAVGPGFRATSTTACAACAAGTMSENTWNTTVPSSAARCHDCALGTYQTTTGATSCLNCPAITIATESISTGTGGNPASISVALNNASSVSPFNALSTCRKERAHLETATGCYGARLCLGATATTNALASYPSANCTGAIRWQGAGHGRRFVPAQSGGTAAQACVACAAGTFSGSWSTSDACESCQSGVIGGGTSTTSGTFSAAQATSCTACPSNNNNSNAVCPVFGATTQPCGFPWTVANTTTYALAIPEACVSSCMGSCIGSCMPPCIGGNPANSGPCNDSCSATCTPRCNAQCTSITGQDAIVGASSHLRCRKNVPFTGTNGNGYRTCTANAATGTDTVYVSNCFYTVTSCVAGMIASNPLPLISSASGTTNVTNSTTIQNNAVNSICVGCESGSFSAGNDASTTCTLCPSYSSSSITISNTDLGGATTNETFGNFGLPWTTSGTGFTAAQAITIGDAPAGGATSHTRCRKRIPFEVRAQVPSGGFNTAASPLGNGLAQTTSRTIGRGYRTCSASAATGSDDIYTANCIYTVTSCGAGRRVRSGFLTATSPYVLRQSTSTVSATNLAAAIRMDATATATQMTDRFLEAVNLACEPCPGGTGTAAQAGTLNDTTSTSCNTTCAATAFASNGASWCTTCPSGAWRWTGATPITTQNGVTGCTTANSFCNTCPAGEMLSADCAGCRQIMCPAGQVVSGTSCVACTGSNFMAAGTLNGVTATGAACNSLCHANTTCTACPAFTDNPALNVLTATHTGFTTTNWGNDWTTSSTKTFAVSQQANSSFTASTGCRKRVPYQTVPTSTAGNAGGCVGEQICNYSGTGTAWSNYSNSCANRVILATAPGFRATNATTCEACPAGTASPNTWVSTIPSASGRCTACGDGLWQNLTGATSCQDCPQRATTSQTLASAGNTSITIAAATSSGSRNAVTTCSKQVGHVDTNCYGRRACSAASTATSASGLDVYNVSCGAATWLGSGPGRRFISAQSGSTAANACPQCLAGTFKNSWSSADCEACAIGTSQPAAGQTSCVGCGDGFWQNQTGQANCQECPVRTTNSENFTSGGNNVSVSLNNATSVSPRNAVGNCRKERAHSTTTCYGARTCAATSATNALASYTDCTGGAIRWQGAAPGHRFVPGSANGTEGQACIACTAGNWKQGFNDDTECTACQPGRVQPNPGQSSCVECGNGLWQNASGQTACNDCPARTTTSQTLATAGNVSITLANADSASPRNAVTTCSKQIGTVDTGAGCYGRRVCSAVSTANATTALATAYTQSCGTITWLGSGPGRRFVSGQSTAAASCVSCAGGTFSTGWGTETACTNCTAGTASNDTGRTSACPNCSSGTFQASAGQTSCPDCPARTTNSDSVSTGGSPATVSVSLNNATSVSPFNAVGNCRKERGHIDTAAGCYGARECSGATTTTNALATYPTCTGAIRWQGAGPGRQFVSAQSGGTAAQACTQCAAGRFSGTWSTATSCDQCAAGSFSAAGASSCSSCRGGVAGGGAAGTSGTYHASQGQSSCTSCPSNNQSTQVTGVPTTGFPYTVSAVNALTGAETLFPAAATAGSVGATVVGRCRKRIPFTVALPNPASAQTLIVGRGYRACNAAGTADNDSTYSVDCHYYVTSCGAGRRAIVALSSTNPYRAGVGGWVTTTDTHGNNNRLVEIVNAACPMTICGRAESRTDHTNAGATTTNTACNTGTLIAAEGSSACTNCASRPRLLGWEAAVANTDRCSCNYSMCAASGNRANDSGFT